MARHRSQAHNPRSAPGHSGRQVRTDPASSSRAGGPPHAGKHNLPAPKTTFVGRGSERVEIKRMLAMTNLLTLTGTGGCGKTRLALEVGRDLVGTYPDGVWLVELAPLSEGALVPQVVAGTLGVQEQPGHHLLDNLLDALRDKEALLILDNCEHLIDAAALLADALLGQLSAFADARYQPGATGCDGRAAGSCRRSRCPMRSTLPPSRSSKATSQRVCSLIVPQ